MKKKFFLFLFLSLFCALLYAGDYTDKGLISGWKFTPLQVDVSLVEKRKLFDESSHTFLALGLFILEQRSAVFSIAGAANALQYNCGLQLNPFFMGTVTEKNYGISFGWENYCKNCYGIQLGLLNYSFAGEEVKKENERIQFCGINIADFLYMGIFNASDKIQIGLFNLGGRNTYFQLGLLNYNPASFLPLLPLVNFNMGRKFPEEMGEKQEENASIQQRGK